VRKGGLAPGSVSAIKYIGTLSNFQIFARAKACLVKGAPPPGGGLNFSETSSACHRVIKRTEVCGSLCSQIVLPFRQANADPREGFSLVSHFRATTKPAEYGVAFLQTTMLGCPHPGQ
jgi:hypothetical protein